MQKKMVFIPNFTAIPTIFDDYTFSSAAVRLPMTIYKIIKKFVVSTKRIYVISNC